MTTSPTSVLLGCQRPQILHLPPGVVSHDAATEAIELAESIGLVLDESQRFTVQCAMGTRGDGSWAAFEVADVEPRQNGKNCAIEARELWGLFLAREDLQIHTAHEFATANESFLRLAGLIESSDELRRRVARIRYANGEQGIELLNGCRLKYRARTGGAGRGFAGASTVYLDEALYLEPAHIGALMPTMATAASKGMEPQVWYASSACLTRSAVMWRIRLRAIKGGAGRLAYVEHTAEQVSINAEGLVLSVPPDPDDRQAWALANAALGVRISEEFVAGERDAMPPAEFLRERLGVWDPAPMDDRPDRPVPPEIWEQRVEPGSSIAAELVLGVGVLPEMAGASIAAVGRRKDGLTHLEVIDSRPGTAWVEGRLKELLAAHRVRAVAVDVGGPSVGLLPELVRLTDGSSSDLAKVSGADYQGACAAFVAAVVDDKVRHLGQAWLATAIGGARRRAVGQSWVWDLRSGDCDASPLVAVTVALRALEQLPAAEFWVY